MIRSVNVKNFESHKETLLDFTSGVNAIVGESDQGKSSILRAIEWVATNRPTGNSFRSHWGGETSVEIITDEYIICRIKGKENKYTLQYLDEKPIKFDAVNKGVPIEITKALGIDPINVQGQFDGHFLLPPMSPGERAKQINQYVDLEIIDTTIANINSTLRALKKKSTDEEAQITEYKEELDKYKYIEDADKLLTDIEKTNNRIKSVRNSLCNLEDIKMGLEDIEIELSEYDGIEDAEKELDVLIELNEDIKKNDIALNKLIAIAEEYTEVTQQIEQLNKIDEKAFDEIESLYEKNKKSEKDLYKLMCLAEDIEEKDVYIKELKVDIARLDKRLKEEMPDVCPLCKQEIRNA
jgi:exonuclease SbcC